MMSVSKLSQNQHIAIQESFLSQIVSLPIRFTVANFFNLDRAFIASVSLKIYCLWKISWKKIQIIHFVDDYGYDDIPSGNDPVE